MSALAAVIFAGCVSQQIQPTMRGGPLSAISSVYVMVPKDGQYEQITYTGSGMQTAMALAAQARNRFASVEIGEDAKAGAGGLGDAGEDRLSEIGERAVEDGGDSKQQVVQVARAKRCQEGAKRGCVQKGGQIAKELTQQSAILERGDIQANWAGIDNQAEKIQVNRP